MCGYFYKLVEGQNTGGDLNAKDPESQKLINKSNDDA